MGRSFTSGTWGTPSIGSLSVTQNTVAAAQANDNLNLVPNGTGVVTVVNALQLNNQAVLRLADADSSNYFGLKSAASMSGNVTMTMPADAGTSNYILTTDGSGTLSWSQKTVDVSDQTISASTFYPLFLGVTTGSVNAVNTSSTKLTFIPSTGTLSSAVGQFSTMTGSSAASGTLTIRGTSNGSKATASVLFDEGVASNSTTTGTVRVTGGVGISGNLYVGAASVFSSTITCTSLTETSSITFKENISPLQNALDSVLQLSGVMYDRKDGSYIGETGLIAEDVVKVIPNVVTKDASGNPHGINYTKLVAYLVESIKSLKEEINELKSR